MTAGTGGWTGSPTAYALQWRRCDSSGGSCSDIFGATGSSYTLASLDVGDTVRVSVTATGAGGAGVAASGRFPTSGTIVSSGGGGGGGGGGGTSVPDLKVSLTASKTTIQPDEESDLTATVANIGGAGALQTHLLIALPATMTLLGPPAYDRGSGCTGAQTLDCYLDYVPNGGTTAVHFAVRVGGQGAQTVTASANADREANPGDNTASIVIQVATTVPPPPPNSKGVTKVGTAHDAARPGTTRCAASEATTRSGAWAEAIFSSAAQAATGCTAARATTTSRRETGGVTPWIAARVATRRSWTRSTA